MGGIDTTLYGLIHDFFMIYLPKHRHCSPNTIRAYRSALEQFLDFTKAQHGVDLTGITFKMLDRDMLLKYLDSVEERGCGISTRNHKLNCIRAFYTYAAQLDPATVIHKSEIDKVPMKKLSKPDIIDHMDEAAIKALLEQPNPLTKKGLRDRFMMMLMYDTAARVQEVVDIRLRDVKLGKKPVIILHGKGAKDRPVPLMKQTVDYYGLYLKAFHADENRYADQPMFYSLFHGCKTPLDTSTVRKLIKAYGKAAGSRCADVHENVHPHLLRHSRAMHLYQHGMDLTLLAQWLGHVNLETTLIYAHADTELKRKAIDSATPAGNPLRSKLNAKRFTVSDDETLKKLYGLKG